MTPRRCVARRPRPTVRADGAEHGFASLVLTGLVSVLVLTTLAVAWLGSALEASHRASAAADLAALAGAQAQQRGADACAASATLAVANDARVVACAVVGSEVSVDVEAEVRAVAGLRVVPTVSRGARAGPVEP